MNLIEKKLWEILQIARSGDLNEVSTNYLKEGLGNFYKKYVLDKDLDFVSFSKWLKSDLKAGRLDEKAITQALYKIYYFHRDLDTAGELKSYKIKLIEDTDKKNIEFEKYELASLNYDKGEKEKALQMVSDAISSLDTNNLKVDTLELYIKSLIMKNQLKQDLKENPDDILDEIKEVETIFINTAKYLDSKKQALFKTQILYLYLSHWLNTQNYPMAIVYGAKAVEAFEGGKLPLNMTLKYRIYEGLSYAYLLNQKYDKAKDTAQKAVALKNKLITIDTFSAIVLLAESALAQREYDEALNYAHEANTMVNNSIEKLEYIYELLAKIYKAKKDDDSAKEYLEKLCRLQEVSKN